jgi:hypothetical protein
MASSAGVTSKSIVAYCTITAAEEEYMTTTVYEGSAFKSQEELHVLA